MGNLCDCLNPKPDDNVPNAKTPLLSGNIRQTPQVRDAAVSSVAVGQSARHHKPDETKKDFTSSLNALSMVSLVAIPSVPSLDKTFQDHAKLYNDLYSTFVDLRKCLRDFIAQFEAEIEGSPTIAACLKMLGSRCGSVKLAGSMTKNCIQITYDKRDISEKCQGPAENVLETLELYNKANTLIKSILAKSPQVKSSINLVIEEEPKLKREVTKADPDGKLGPEPLRRTSDNFTKLHKLPGHIDTIQKYTSKTFKEIVSGSKILFQDT